MPLTVFGTNLIIINICVLWLCSGNYKNKFYQLINNKLIIVSMVFMPPFSWTILVRRFEMGLHIVHKMWYFLLLLLILFTIVVKENIRLYIAAFLLAIALTEIVSYLI